MIQNDRPQSKLCLKIFIFFGDMNPMPSDNPGLKADRSDEVIGDICPT